MYLIFFRKDTIFIDRPADSVASPLETLRLLCWCTLSLAPPSRLSVVLLIIIAFTPLLSSSTLALSSSLFSSVVRPSSVFLSLLLLFSLFAPYAIVLFTCKSDLKVVSQSLHIIIRSERITLRVNGFFRNCLCCRCTCTCASASPITSLWYMPLSIIPFYYIYVARYSDINV
jgi:hypothetical protein